VRATHLTPESIVHAMEAGDFYASSGVELTKLERTEKGISLEIVPESGVTYVPTFIGTRRAYDPTRQLFLPPESEPSRKSLPRRRYSKDVGAALGKVTGTTASYFVKGDELYVRAKIVSSKLKENGSVPEEYETAWIQTILGPGRLSARSLRWG